LEKDPKSYVPKYDEQMPKEDMLEEIKKNLKLKALPDRKTFYHKDDIFS
jgi:hypothetical protein